MTFLRRLFITACSAWALTSAAIAQEAAQSTAAIVAKTWHVNYAVDPDGRVTETFASVYQVQQESALERVKVFSIAFSTSIQSGEFLEAYTIKKDGRRIEAPATNYQTEVNDGRSGASPLFSDRTRVSVVYPDLAVGDSVGVRYRITEKEPMFPGQFSRVVTLSPYEVYEDAQITLTVPSTMKLLSQASFLDAAPAIVADGLQTLRWNYRQLKPRQWDEEADSGIWRMNEFPSLLVSTFPNYESIAKAYGDRALPKAAPTPRIHELAQQIVGSEPAPRERARLVYEWVSKNITYGGNCIGVGAVVPRDLDVVLDNKMGDCKDHATLMQALLAAAGIASEQVLINAGSEYELAPTPVVSMVNHVINYLPAFKLYLDSTAKEVPFGLLPMEDNGKPVIHVAAAQAQALATTPNQQHDKQVQRLQMSLKLTDDGRATGELKLSITGLQAAGARAYMRNLSGDAERDFAKRALAAYGFKGQGTLSKGDTSGLSDHYAYSVLFDIDNYLDSGAAGAFVLAPVMGSPLAIMSFAGINARPIVRRRHTCYGFHTYESYDIALPATIKLTNLPENLRLKGSVLDYTAQYQRTKTGVSVTRELHDKTDHTVCTPGDAAELLQQALPMAENLRTKVLYQRKLTPKTKP